MSLLFHLVGYLLLLVNLTESSRKLDIQFSTDYTSYNISVDGIVWLQSGFTGFHIDSQWIIPKLISNTKTNGNDPIGNYNEITLSYTDNTNSTNEFKTHFRYYTSKTNILIFSQSFPNGLTNTQSKHSNDIISSFPSFKMQKPNWTPNLNLGYYHFAGNQATSLGSQSAPWTKSGAYIFKGGTENSGPIAIFDEYLNNTIVISSLTYPMAINNYNTLTVDNTTDPEIQFGLQGLINNIESGFTVQFIMTASDKNVSNQMYPNNMKYGVNGINSAMREWGINVLKYFDRNIHDNDYGHSKDYTLNYLGYSTDNGAYYYYWTETNKTYEQTLIDVKTYHNKMNIPTKYVLMDSWWYYHGEGGGILNWTAPSNIFPNGVQYIAEKTDWKIQAHSKFFSTDTVYQNNIQPVNNTLYNGTQFPFTIGTDNKAIPLTYEFWKYFFEINMDWNLIVYEQDWIEQTSDAMSLVLNTTYFGQEWLLQMGMAAAVYDLCIQYCSAYPRHLLTSVQLPTMTQTRASGDYSPAHSVQWQIGVSSIFVISLGISPSKDSFWTTTIPQDSKYGKHTVAKDVELNGAVLSLSNGPYTFADQIGYSNISLIMKCCNSDGLILRPDVSATMIDRFFLFDSGLDIENPFGQIWSTYSMIGNEGLYKYYYILSAVIPKKFEFYPSDLSYHFRNMNDSLGTWLVFDFRSPSHYFVFNNDNPLIINECFMIDFSLYTLIPINSNYEIDDIWYVQGEFDKWISVSKQRFQSINMDFDNGNTEIVIKGAFNETVNVAFVNPKEKQQRLISCIVGESLIQKIKMPEGTCNEI